MFCDGGPASVGQTFAQRKRHGDTDYEHKKGLDEVPKSESVPRVVFQLQGKSVECGILRQFGEIVVKTSGLCYQ